MENINQEQRDFLKAIADKKTFMDISLCKTRILPEPR
jgi:hypothetical protein